MNDDKRPLRLREVLRSVLSSFVGVQNDATRERDFTHGRARDFVIVGLVLTAVFVGMVWGVVQLVMRVAGPS